MVRGNQGKTGKIVYRVLQIPHCCCVLEYIRNGIAKKLENFASKNTREFILRHPVQKNDEASKLRNQAPIVFKFCISKINGLAAIS
jgi:hypothetical protein